jgi:hypothetical protein
MRLRKTAEVQDAAGKLIQEHNLNATGVLVVSSWVNPVPMVLHRSSRFTEFGDITFAIVLLLVARASSVGMFGDLVISTISGASVSWFLFRIYYDIRFFKAERMILLPPNVDDNVLLHELLHVHLGHIEQMSLRHQLLALSPLGPLEYILRDLRHDYGGEGVVGELHNRVKARTKVTVGIPGIFTFGYFAFVFFFVFLFAITM